MRAPAKLILQNHLAPVDILMLTVAVAVRDLHLGHQGRFVTDVHTPCPNFWLCYSCVTLASTVLCTIFTFCYLRVFGL